MGELLLRKIILNKEWDLTLEEKIIKIKSACNLRV